jgi:hypothetical protein
MRAKTTAATTQQKALWLLEMLFPPIGKRPIREVTPPELLEALRKIEAKGFHATAHRAKQKCGQIFRYAIATGRAERDISADLWVRSMASTLIELQLAHAERNKVRAAYNKAQRLAERRKMLQMWADHLDLLRTGKDVVIPTPST